MELDFLGKDSIRYKNHVTVEKLVSALTSVTVFTVVSLAEPGRAWQSHSDVQWPGAPPSVPCGCVRRYNNQGLNKHTYMRTHMHTHIHTHKHM